MNARPIYLASPYTHKSKFIQELRYRATRENVARLMNLGEVVFSPIVHCHWISEIHNMPGDFNFWKNYDECLITNFPRFGILKLPGFRESEGIHNELHFAKGLGRNTEYIEPIGEVTRLLQLYEAVKIPEMP